MEARWERSLDHANLVIPKDNDAGTDGFETKMVCIGGVPGLLPMTVRQMDGETAFVYDVTARQPLAEHLKGRALDQARLADILEAALGVVEGLAPFLLEASHLLFSADRVFVEGNLRELRFCYLPSHEQPMREGFYGLVMELIAGTDRQDRGAILLGYRFAHALQGENVTLEELREILQGSRSEAGKASQEGLSRTLSKSSAGEEYESLGRPEIVLSGSADLKNGSGDGRPETGRRRSGALHGEKSADSGKTGADWDRSGASDRTKDAGGGRSEAAPGLTEVSSWDGGEEPGVRKNRGFLLNAFRRKDSEGAEDGRPEEKAGKGVSGGLGINRRTLMIVAVGGLILLLAYLSMHTEVPELVLETLAGNPLLLAVPVLFAGAAAFALLLRRKLQERRLMASAAADFGDRYFREQSRTSDRGPERGRKAPVLPKAASGRGAGASEGGVKSRSGTDLAAEIYEKYRRSRAGNFSEAAREERPAAADDRADPAVYPSRNIRRNEFSGNLREESSGSRREDFARNRREEFSGNRREEFSGNRREEFSGSRREEFSGNLRNDPPGIPRDAQPENRWEEEAVTCLLSPAKTGSAKLVPCDREKAFGEIRLREGGTIIGKQPDLVDAVIRSPVVSRVHARICRREDGWVVADLNSRNGTFLKGELLTPMEDTPLSQGDVLRFANLDYTFEEGMGVSF